jgi:hypothetical protein
MWRQHRRKYHRADSIAAPSDLKRKLGGKRVHARAAGALPLRPYQAEMDRTILRVPRGRYRRSHYVPIVGDVSPRTR